MCLPVVVACIVQLTSEVEHPRKGFYVSPGNIPPEGSTPKASGGKVKGEQSWSVGGPRLLPASRAQITFPSSEQDEGYFFVIS